MASLKDIRKRIGSVKNTQKITKAMKMVAAAKLRRSQQALMAARPYGDQLAALVSQLAGSEGVQHPLFDHMSGPVAGETLRQWSAPQGGDQPQAQAAPPPPDSPPFKTRARLVVLSSDRGFCGGFNGNLLRRVLDWLKVQAETGVEVDLQIIGKKGRDFFKAKGREIAGFETGVYEGFNFGKARARAVQLTKDYLAGAFDECYFVYNRFKSAMSQDVTFCKLLPISQEGEGKGPEPEVGHIYEPAVPQLLDELIPRTLATLIFRFFLESIASEFGARMVAMDGATKNCAEMIDGLTLTANRLRQAAITSELMDIVNGAEAL